MTTGPSQPLQPAGVFRMKKIACSALVSVMVAAVPAMTSAQTGGDLTRLAANRPVTTLTEVLVNGDKIELSHVLSIVADDQGAVYLADGMAESILVVDPVTKTILRRIGRE